MEILFDKTINHGSASSVVFLSTTELFPAHSKILEHETQSSALTIFQVLETILDCSKTVLRTLNHCLLGLEIPINLSSHFVHQYGFRARLKTKQTARILLRL